VEAGFPKRLPTGSSRGIALKQQSKARLPVSADIARFRCKRAAWQGRPRRLDNGIGRTGNKKPGPSGPGFFELSRTLNQAAGLNSLLALAFSGSTVSVATFCDSSVSSLLQAENASNCFLA
jgi:hypothetical protein